MIVELSCGRGQGTTDLQNLCKTFFLTQSRSDFQTPQVPPVMKISSFVTVPGIFYHPVQPFHLTHTQVTLSLITQKVLQLLADI
jgi:hypothetical protein